MVSLFAKVRRNLTQSLLELWSFFSYLLSLVFGHKYPSTPKPRKNNQCLICPDVDLEQGWGLPFGPSTSASLITSTPCSQRPRAATFDTDSTSHGVDPAPLNLTCTSPFPSTSTTLSNLAASTSDTPISEELLPAGIAVGHRPYAGASSSSFATGPSTSSGAERMATIAVYDLDSSVHRDLSHSKMGIQYECPNSTRKRRRLTPYIRHRPGSGVICVMPDLLPADRSANMSSKCLSAAKTLSIIDNPSNSSLIALKSARSFANYYRTSLQLEILPSVPSITSSLHSIPVEEINIDHDNNFLATTSLQLTYSCSVDFGLSLIEQFMNNKNDGEADDNENQITIARRRPWTIIALPINEFTLPTSSHLLGLGSHLKRALARDNIETSDSQLEIILRTRRATGIWGGSDLPCLPTSSMTLTTSSSTFGAKAGGGGKSGIYDVTFVRRMFSLMRARDRRGTVSDEPRRVFDRESVWSCGRKSVKSVRSVMSVVSVAPLSVSTSASSVPASATTASLVVGVEMGIEQERSQEPMELVLTEPEVLLPATPALAAAGLEAPQTPLAAPPASPLPPLPIAPAPLPLSISTAELMHLLRGTAGGRDAVTLKRKKSMYAARMRERERRRQRELELELQAANNPHPNHSNPNPNLVNDEEDVFWSTTATTTTNTTTNLRRSVLYQPPLFLINSPSRRRPLMHRSLTHIRAHSLAHPPGGSFQPYMAILPIDNDDDYRRHRRRCRLSTSPTESALSSALYLPILAPIPINKIKHPRGNTRYRNPPPGIITSPSFQLHLKVEKIKRQRRERQQEAREMEVKLELEKLELDPSFLSVEPIGGDRRRMSDEYDWFAANV
ncbi:hypothetical protein AMATHDRAFT_43840 [Amanita thiersii Skay4041]|uniref:Uncharacterized protein n=1 Tax=Amanita thiersii Skay4041 TaxID=703135 RepID=A0A2A9NE21_9AGAR|nr:hypothetical protein AMATHDRAFT_43840 [Amanita thiersii Skay4041]